MNNNSNDRSQPKRARGSSPSAAPAGEKKKIPHRNNPLCRTSQYQPPGSDKVGLLPNNQPSKVVWELDYGLSTKQFEQLSQRFPGIAFVQTGMDCHDHPIAHTSYRVVWENVTRKIPPGSLVADISGNPAFNEKFNKKQATRRNPIKIDTFVKVMSTKDSIRKKTRWGPELVGNERRWEEVSLYDMYRNEENRARFGAYDYFLMNQCLYYYTKAEINSLLALNKEAVLVATIHKLPGQNGKINCGEQEYEKDIVTGKVVQRNVETGEKYEHPDPQSWFSQFSYADEHGAMAWTINKGCDDTYVVTVTSTDPCLVPADDWLGGRIVVRNHEEVVTVTVPEAADPPPAYTVEEVVLKTHDLLPGYTSQKELKVQITHPELFSSLKGFMINKPRNARTLQDLTAKAHREVGNNTLVGNNHRVKISSEALTKHIFAAWMAGVGHEAEMFQAASSHLQGASVNRNLAGKSLSVNSGNYAKQALRFALSASVVARSKEPVHAVLAQIDELL